MLYHKIITCIVLQEFWALKVRLLKHSLLLLGRIQIHLEIFKLLQEKKEKSNQLNFPRQRKGDLSDETDSLTLKDGGCLGAISQQLD